jgi:ABC-type transporter Mla subunit MlaD
VADSGLSIGTLSGRIELDDHFTATITLSNTALDELEKRFGKVDNTVRHTAEGFVVAEIALKAVEEVAHLAAEGLDEITTVGAQVADVEENFNKITLAAGQLGDELLGALHEGSHNTITDFSLMKSVNDNLAAGINLTKQQYSEIATGAFALAQAKGLDVAAAFEKINDAMVTGKIKGVQYLTGKIDLADAEDRYAKSIGTTSDRLTAEEKAEAGRMVILEKVTAATQRLGEQQDGLDEKVAQVRTQWKNFEEDLSKTIATSPVVINAFDQIKGILTDAFGTDREQAIKNVTHAVEEATKVAVTLVGAGVDVVKFMYEYKSVIEPVVVGLGAYYAASLLAEGGTKAMTLAVEGLELAATPLGAVAIAAGAIYAAFEIGKWQPVSDFFEKLGLETFYGMSSAEADLAVKTHHLTDEAVALSKGTKELKESEEEIALATQNWREKLDTIDGRIVDWAEHLLASGVSARSVATEYGLTAGQVRALEADLANTNKTLADATKRAAELAAGQRMSREETKQFAIAWEQLITLGGTYKDVLATVNPAIIASVQYYAQIGASVDDLTKAFPGLTKAQAEAAVEGVKSAMEIQKVWIDVFATRAKMHGDNIRDFIKLETDRFNLTVEQLRQQGKATDEMLDAEKAKYFTTIDAEIQKREQQITTSRAFYQQEVDDAKAKLDLMKTHSQDFIDRDIRNSERDYIEKSRQLERWAQMANDTIDNQEKNVKENADKQKKAIDGIGDSWDRVGGKIDLDTEKVRTLSGEIISLREYEQRQNAGGSFDVTSQNFIDTAMGLGLDLNRATTMAKQGYSLQEIQQILGSKNNGPIPPPHGPKIPGFKDGGIGDFGDGTLAMLHGPEAITPLGSGGAGIGGVVHIHDGAFQLNYPIMTDRTAMSQLGKVAGNALVQVLEEKGIRVGQRNG